MSATVFDYRKGMVINENAPPNSTEAKAPYVDHGTTTISPDRYRSKEIHDLEWERMWTRVWTLAGFVSDIPKVGDYFKYDLGRESFIVVRSKPDKIQAYYNVCPHRGNQLLTADFGTISGAINVPSTAGALAWTAAMSRFGTGSYSAPSIWRTPPTSS